MRSTIVCLTVALVACAALSSRAFCDDKDAVAADRKPGPGHEKLKPLAGKFATVSKVWMAPGAEPKVSKGHAENRWILGGRFLEGTYRGEFLGSKFEGRMLVGFDNATKSYTKVWVDSLLTSTTVATGTFDETGKKLALAWATGKTREVIRIESENKHVLEMWDQVEGKDVQVLEVEYTRVEK